MKTPSSLGIPAVGPAKPSPAPTPAFQAAPRPGAPSAKSDEPSLDFPVGETVAPKAGDGSLLTLLPLEPEAEKPPKAGAAAPKVTAPPVKAQIGGTVRPSVLGTSKLSPAAKVPPKTGAPAAPSMLKPEPRTAVGKSVAPSTLSASLNQRTSNSVVGPLPKSGLGAPLRPGTAPLPPSPTSGRGVPAPGYQRTGNSVVGPLPRPPLSGIGTSSGAPARPEPAIGVKVASTTAVGTATPAPEPRPEPRPSNVQAGGLGTNTGVRKSTVVGFQQASVGGYEHGAKADAGRAHPSFSDDFDDQPTLIGDSSQLAPYLEAERALEAPSEPKPVAPVVPAADEFENAPRIRSSALGLLVPSEVIGTPRTTEPLDLSDDDLVPAGSLPPLALPPTSPHAVVPSALLEAPHEPPLPVAPPPPKPTAPAIMPPAAPGADPMAQVPRPAPIPQAAAPAAPAQPVAFNSTVSGESTLIVRSRYSELEDVASKPKRRYGLYAVGALVAIGLGTVGALFATGKLQLPGSQTTGTVATTGAATTGAPTTGQPTTTGSTANVAVTVDAGAVAVDAGVVAIDAGAPEVDAGAPAIDAGVAAVVPPVEPPPVVPTADPSDLSGITPDSELPSSGPRASDILVGDALRLMEQGRLDAANVALTRAMELDRINPQGYEAVARYHIARRDYARAIEAATHATELRSRDSRYFVVLGDAQLASGDRAAAIASWRQAVSIDRNREARERLEANP